ncbi:hypothetical protein EDC01DRAFT_679277 [Geopyxis carbonaria]|nr:hypothetical protein EDC01DRAFT_679277 [Geopyxis carbonaria]
MATPSPLEIFFSSLSHPLPPRPADPNIWAHFKRLPSPTKGLRKRFIAAFTTTYHSPIDRFFTPYITSHKFEYEPKINASISLEQLQKRIWPRCKQSNKKARMRFRDAFHKAFEIEFGDYFGYDDHPTREEQLEKWRFLCEVVGIDHEGLGLTSATQFKRALSRIHVDIWDLLHHVRSGNPGLPMMFDSREELADHIEEPYPRKWAKRGALKFLLRKVSPQYFRH